MWRSNRVVHVVSGLLALGLSGCFPTFHNARIDPGFRLDAGATTIRDQPREGQPQPADYLAYVSPAVGIGHRVEVGLPLVWHAENGLRGQDGGFPAPGLMFYTKFALLKATSLDHLAVFVQGGLPLIPVPTMAGIRYGRDRGTWEPHAGLTFIASGDTGEFFDVLARYAQRRQSLITMSVGATWNVAGFPGVEMGVLRNAYDEDRFTSRTPVIVETSRRTLYDLFFGFRVSTGTRKQQEERRAARRR
jgi:hypothetical protein